MQSRALFCATAVSLAAAALVGCASPSATEHMSSQVQTRSSAAQAAFEAQARPRAAVREIAGASSDFRTTGRAKPRGDVTLKAAATPFGAVFSELGKRAGFSVAFADGVDVQRRITVDFNQATPEDALRMTAFLAGYVVVLDRTQQTAMVAEVGTYTFKLPGAVFSQLQASYNVGGNPANSSSGGGSGGGSAGGTSLRAEFSVQGRDGTSPDSLTQFLTSLAGRSSEVVVASTGHISVRGNAQSLRRVHEFLRKYAQEAMTQVEIEASVVEVSLERDFRMGIQWSRVIDRATGGVKGGIIGGSQAGGLMGALTSGDATALTAGLATAATQPGLSAFRVTNSSASLVEALAEFTDVNIVSQPRLLSLNNMPATFFDGQQLPYLGSMEQTPSSTAGGQPTVSGSVAFAIDGISFSAVPSVVTQDTVQITLIPVLSNVSSFETFLGGQLTAPVQGNKQSYMRVLADSGKTLILGGIRYKKSTGTTSAPASVSSSGGAKEVVILLRANVLQAPAYDPVVSETL